MMVTPEEPKPDTIVTIHVNIPQKSKMKVGIEDLNVGDKKTATIKGKITSVNHDEYGKGFGMNVDSIAFSDNKGTMKEDFEELEESRKG